MTCIVVASGKGGTGKTLVATALALAGAEMGPVALLDADVEAPNAGLFLQPTLTSERPVQHHTPVVDEARCTHCGRCAQVCAFHAIASLPARTLVFAELCHGCGNCSLNCPEGAISEVPYTIGTVHAGRAGGVDFAEGRLVIGEAMATPIIRSLGRYAHEQGWQKHPWLIVDAPPGTACPVIETMRLADVALLVTEPTPFGLHDLQLAVDVARDVLRLPVGVVLNKDGGGAADVEAYCRAQGLPILLRIPYRRDIAVACSTGQPLTMAMPEYRQAFRSLLWAAGAMARQGGA